jgi:signal peptidase I
VQCCDKQGRLTVNGKPIAEDYLNTDSSTASLLPFKSTVPKGSLFMLGDNRQVSEDSRIHLDDAEQGAVPASDVKGRVEATAWPLGRLGMLPGTSAFDALPGGGQSPQGPLRWLAYAVIAGAVMIMAGAAYGPLSGLVRRK